MLDANGNAINGNLHLQIPDTAVLSNEQLLLICKALFFHELRGVQGLIDSTRRSVLEPKKYGGQSHKQLRAKCGTLEHLLKASAMFGSIRANAVAGCGSQCVYLIVVPLSVSTEKTRGGKIWLLEELSYPATIEAAQREAADEAARKIMGGKGVAE